MEVTKFSEVSTYSTDRGWAAQAPIKTQSRIDVPRQFASVSEGIVNVAGVAYAQRRGIAKVEVRVDDGTGGSPSRHRGHDRHLAPVGLPLGRHQGLAKILVRATDTTGHTRPPIGSRLGPTAPPDGTAP